MFFHWEFDTHLVTTITGLRESFSLFRTLFTIPFLWTLVTIDTLILSANGKFVSIHSLFCMRCFKNLTSLILSVYIWSFKSCCCHISVVLSFLLEMHENIVNDVQITIHTYVIKTSFFQLLFDPTLETKCLCVVLRPTRMLWIFPNPQMTKIQRALKKYWTTRLLPVDTL